MSVINLTTQKTAHEPFQARGENEGGGDLLPPHSRLPRYL